MRRATRSGEEEVEDEDEAEAVDNAEGVSEAMIAATLEDSKCAQNKELLRLA